MSHLGRFSKNKLYNFLNPFISKFSFLFFFFYFKAIFIYKSNFNYFKFSIKTTDPNKSNARACMLKHVAKPYDGF